jgi:hypothetical protein
MNIKYIHKTKSVGIINLLNNIPHYKFLHIITRHEHKAQLRPEFQTELMSLMLLQSRINFKYSM